MRKLVSICSFSFLLTLIICVVASGCRTTEAEPEEEVENPISPGLLPPPNLPDNPGSNNSGFIYSVPCNHTYSDDELANKMQLCQQMCQLQAAHDPTMKCHELCIWPSPETCENYQNPCAEVGKANAIGCKTPPDLVDRTKPTTPQRMDAFFSAPKHCGSNQEDNKLCLTVGEITLKNSAKSRDSTRESTLYRKYSNRYEAKQYKLKITNTYFRISSLSYSDQLRGGEGYKFYFRQLDESGNVVAAPSPVTKAGTVHFFKGKTGRFESSPNRQNYDLKIGIFPNEPTSGRCKFKMQLFNPGRPNPIAEMIGYGTCSG
ncbi:MAG: hypothetical protein OXC40_07175 [Proteobacteria bacterium]|nr:hypothetical protein [Pseudomonadota bacterium]